MAAANQGNPDTAQSVYDFTVKDIKGNDVSLEKYKGHVLIIVNVASKCGYTAKHYAELNEIYDQYAESKGKFWMSANVMMIQEVWTWEADEVEKQEISFWRDFKEFWLIKDQFDSNLFTYLDLKYPTWL